MYKAIESDKRVSVLFSLITSFIIVISLTCNSSRKKPAGLDVYIIRHAQTVANVKMVYTEETLSTFSEKGKEQIRAVTDILNPYQFDEILVSPALRTLHTILPYLKAVNRVGIIWPEIVECCWQDEKNIKPSKTLPRGDKIELEETIKPYFKFREEAAGYHRPDEQNYIDGIEQLRSAYQLLEKKYFNSGKSILLVCHSLAGSRIIELLLGREPIGEFHLENAKVTHIKQKEDGSFSLVTLNNVPY